MKGSLHFTVVWIQQPASLGGILVRRTLFVLWFIPLVSWDRDISMSDTRMVSKP